MLKHFLDFRVPVILFLFFVPAMLTSHTVFDFGKVENQAEHYGNNMHNLLLKKLPFQWNNYLTASLSSSVQFSNLRPQPRSCVRCNCAWPCRCKMCHRCWCTWGENQCCQRSFLWCNVIYNYYKLNIETCYFLMSYRNFSKRTSLMENKLTEFWNVLIGNHWQSV